MSIENLEGNGNGDQPSIIYSFDDGDKIRELSRSGYGEPGPSPGDVVERESTRSDPSTRLPEFELPGQRGLAQDDCGEEVPAFACAGDDGCGRPVFVGRTCGSPICKRDWPSAVKEKVRRYAGKLDGLRRLIYSEYDGGADIDFNHVIASLPTFAVDSDEPLERALLTLKTLLEEQWGIEGFAAIYHPYRIKQEYRKDQYDHGGEQGEGDMTWADVLNSDNPLQYIKFEPHFHLFFPAVRQSFDYAVAEAVEEQSGWLFHRITKGEESNVSVEDLNDLVHQLTYCLSHAGVRETADRHELASRLKGRLHNCYPPDGIEEEVLAAVAEAGPTLLGVQFVNTASASCTALVGDRETDEMRGHEEGPVETTRTPEWESGAATGGGSSADDFGTHSGPTSQDGSERDTAAADGDADDEWEQRDVEECGGDLEPMAFAVHRLDDEEWYDQAEFAEELAEAAEVWEELDETTRQEPWDVDEEARMTRR